MAAGERSISFTDRERALLYGAMDYRKQMLKRQINGEVNEGVKALRVKELDEVELCQRKLV